MCACVQNLCGMYFFFFFFKQRTAYEMCISDWSSDVCSSDLEVAETLGDADDLHVRLFARIVPWRPALAGGRAAAARGGAQASGFTHALHPPLLVPPAWPPA